MAKRGGFLGGLFSAAKKIFSPIIGNVGKVVSGLLGGAKKKATQVAHNAISNVAQASQTGLRTGNWKGAAQQAYNRSAVGTAQGHYTQSRQQMRDAVSHEIGRAQKQMDDRMERTYSSWRQHPRFEQPRYRQQYGAPPPRQWRGYYGSGFGKSQLKSIEKKAHAAIDKIHKHGHKHTKAGIASLRKGTKKAGAKKAAKAAISKVHKEAGAGIGP